MTERTVLVRIKGDASSFVRAAGEAAAAAGALRKEVNTTTDRSAWLAQGILALAPAAVRLGAAAVPAIAGIATQMTVAAGAVGVLALAFHGVGDALTKLNTYQLEPTAAHLQALQVAMSKIGPDGRQFVHFLDHTQAQLSGLADTARAGVFPGVEDGIKHLMTLLPQVDGIIGQIAQGLGDLAAEGGKNLAGPKFAAFFQFLQTDARGILQDMGRTVGNIVEGLANMLVAFSGTSTGFSHGLLDMSRSFAAWSRSLDSNQSFQNFLKYVNDAGPQALAFLGSLIDAGAGLIKAWAPVGQVTLPILTDLLTMIAKIADTPLGPAILGIGALIATYGRLAAIAEVTGAKMVTSMGRFEGGLVAQTKAARAGIPTFTQLGNATLHAAHSQDQLNKYYGTSRKYGKENARVAMESRDAVGKFARSVVPAGLAVGAFALLSSGAADSMNLTSTASLGLAGSMVGPLGTALGVTAGAVLDYKHVADQASQAQKNLAAVMGSSSSTFAQISSAIAGAVAQQAAYNAMSEKGSTLAGALKETATNPIGVVQYDIATLTGQQAARDAQVQDALRVQFNAKSSLLEMGKMLGDASLSNTTPTTLGLDKALALADRVQPAMDALGYTMKDLTGPSFEKVTRAVVAFTEKADTVPAKTHAVGAAFAAMSDQTQAFSDRVKALADSFDALLGPGLNLSAAADALHQGLNDLGKSLDKGSKSLKGFSNASITNRGVVRGQVSAITDWINAEAAHHVPASKMTSDLKAQRQALINTGAAAGISRKDMNHYLDTLGLTPKMVRTAINLAGAPDARNAIKGVQDGLNALKDRTVHVSVITKYGHGVRSTGGTSYDTGGYTGPGPRTEPRGIVHAGEVVIPQDRVARDWEALKARYGDLPGFADGGYVGATRSDRGGGGSTLQLNLNDMQITGTLNTAWGPSSVAGIARSEATKVYRRESNRESRWERSMSGG